MSRREEICFNSLLLCVLVLPVQAAELPARPQLKPGVFERRVALERMLGHVQWSHPVASQRSESAAALNEEIQIIDQRYSLFISAVADSAYRRDAAEVSALCGGADNDPIGLLTCRLANYIIGARKNEGQFVAQFPTAGRNLQALWMVGRIPNGKGGRPILFEPDGPTDLYINELYRIVEKGSPRALGTYVRVYCAADGEYAEFMQDQMEKLFREHIEVVLRNWAEFKKCSAFLSSLRGEFSKSERQAILTDAHQYCGGYPTACNKLNQLFSH